LIETFAARPAEAPVLEVLTGRELDVFRLVASGLTNAKKA
jgi:DNA-binding NarL/FixJ family response regulator